MTFSSHTSSLVVRFLGFSHLLIAVGSGACVIVSLNVLGLGGGNWLIAAFISSCTGLGYSIQRFIKAKLSPDGVPSERLEFLERFGVRLIFVWTLVWFCAFSWVMEEMDYVAWFMLGLLGVAGLGYAMLPWPLWKWARPIREIPGMKLPVLSIVWGCTTVVLPVLMLGQWSSIEPEVFLGVLVARLLYISGLTIPFDVRDLNVDLAEMRTVPMVWGVITSLWCAWLLAVISGGVWAYLGEIPLAIHALITAILVSPKVYKPYRGEWYYSIVLDGMLFLQLLVICS